MIALYTNAPVNASAASATVIVVYLGANSSTPDYDTAATLKDALAGAASRLTSVTTYPVSSGPGNTSYGCETGNVGANPIAACAWATDRTVGFLLQGGTDADVTKLAALEKKMQPDLVRE